MKNLSCEQNEPVRCVLRLFGASALGVQQAASAFPPEWCVTAQCRSRGAETLIALRSENAAGLDKARRSLHGCFAADLYGEGDTDLAAAVVQALEHRRRLLVCADAAAGALMEARLGAVPGVLTCRTENGCLIAVPRDDSRPFPLEAMFCFAQPRQVKNRDVWVFRFNSREWPVF